MHKLLCYVFTPILSNYFRTWYFRTGSFVNIHRYTKGILYYTFIGTQVHKYTKGIALLQKYPIFYFYWYTGTQVHQRDYSPPKMSNILFYWYTGTQVHQRDYSHSKIPIFGLLSSKNFQ